MPSMVIVTPLEELRGFHEVHIHWPTHKEEKVVSVSQLRNEFQSLQQYCQAKQYRLLFNFTGGFDIPELQEEATE